MSLRLREVREARGLSQQQLAKLAKVSVGALSEIERDLREPGYRWLCRVANALGCTMDELVNCADEPNK